MKVFYFVIFSIFSTLSFSQHVYLTRNFFESDVVVDIVVVDTYRDKRKCDWVIYLTENEHIAKVNSGLWFTTDNKEDADFLVYITHVPQIANKKICFTIEKNEVRMD